MEEKQKRQKAPQDDDLRFIEFWGGKKIVFSLLVLIMIGILIMIFNQVSFIFRPLQVIFSTIVAPLVLAIIFFYVLNPLVTWLEKKKLKRLYGTLLVFVLFLLLLAYGIILLIPIIVEQISGFVSDFPGYIDTLSSRIEEFAQGSAFESYYHDAMASLNGVVGDIPSMIWDWVMSSSQEIVSVFSTISNVVVVIVTFPIILFFMLVDRGKFKPFAMKMLPPLFRDDISIVSERMTNVVGSYIVGEALVALSLGALLLAGYLIIGLDYAFVLAIIATVTAIVPYIGATIGILPALIVAAFTSPVMLLKMGVVWGVAQFIQGNVIEPNIMGRTLKMHPLTIIVVLLIAGNLLGVIGMIIGVPLFAIIKVLFEYVFEKFKKRYNHFYAPVAGSYQIDKEIAGDTVTVDLEGNIKEED
ncbi:AI-2E family transporter [Jeotgalibaca caeni]|uniref:AI-2E family transporter n=1 Tax=Jeotgalibaca caeni TaxID=3028623 RepID=UPI00237DFFA8|nr:AI-2E family transporter [Jeotgalibaca caeni]MDE1549987.1 AI-2E family transporter [Jeotgalibaca caeni]